ncbi:DUF1161 domain-containing protein [Pseudorhodoferax sp. Leaf274]|uniref:DUF1161 domain-containing protein n=1 Tax=Pseudorhodoferax sp. Leaf274 TaxID=1736318 RepID=UPI000702BBED|nr:DUF1161 domain-containing protein [Pseudorhodoferax sp. Leaf274]KQP43545.1 hypothetical protein ASF44_29935 [Pseudorhodoferax sp. Leaf274]
MTSWPIPLLCLLAAGAHAADNCEDLRAGIEARIRAGGIANPVVSVVEAEQPAAGKVVGSCAMGRRKIVYTQPDVPPRSDTAILTECRDGSTPVDGRCGR